MIFLLLVTGLVIVAYLQVRPGGPARLPAGSARIVSDWDFDHSQESV